METEIESRSWKQELKTGVGNGNNEQRLETWEVEKGWQQGLATFIGKKSKGTRNKEKGLETGGWEQELKEDYKD